MTTIAGRVWAFGHNVSADNGIIQYSQVPDLGTFDIPALKADVLCAVRSRFPVQSAAWRRDRRGPAISATTAIPTPASRCASRALSPACATPRIPPSCARASTSGCRSSPALA